MKVYVLKVRLKFEDNYEIIGVFDCPEKVAEAKQEYMDKHIYIPEDEFNFAMDTFELNELS